MTRVMVAYWRVPDRYQEIPGIGLAIEALHLQQQHEHNLQMTLVNETLSRLLLKLTRLARDAVDHGRRRNVVSALQGLCGAALFVSVNAALVGDEGVHD